MNADDLKAFMAENKLSKYKMHLMTGVARTTIDRYFDGTSPIPRVFALACLCIKLIKHAEIIEVNATEH